MKTLIVQPKENGKKLNTYISSHFPHLKQNNLYKALRKKDIKINGKRISENVILKENDEISIYISDELLNGSDKNSNIDIKIIYEDEQIIVFFKPVGIEVEGKDSFTELIQKEINTSYLPCHRLDRNTSGLILYAKNIEIQSILFDKFKNREIEKYYHATVIGIPKNKKATLNDYLFKDTKKSRVYISHTPKTGYSKIITQYSVISSDIKSNTSLLDVQILTGRTHQIRAHLAFIGYPILGDGKYGNNSINKQLHKNTQELISYKLKFAFKADAGILNYLNNKTISI